jgi:hypothetical protein
MTYLSEAHLPKLKRPRLRRVDPSRFSLYIANPDARNVTFAIKRGMLDNEELRSVQIVEDHKKGRFLTVVHSQEENGRLSMSFT